MYLIEACATIGDWAFIFLHILNTVLLLETWAIIRENTALSCCWILQQIGTCHMAFELFMHAYMYLLVSIREIGTQIRNCQDV